MNENDFTRLDEKVAALCDEDAAEVCAQYAARQKLETEAIFFSDMRGGARTLMEHCLLHEVEADDPTQKEAFADCPALRILQAEAMALQEIKGFLISFGYVACDDQNQWIDAPYWLTGSEERAIAQAARDSDDVYLEWCKAKTCHWDWFEEKRTIGAWPTFRLLLPNGCTAKFRVHEDEPRIDLGFFSAPPHRQGNAAATLRDFKLAFQIMTTPATVNAIESPVLAAPMPDEITSRIHLKDGKDWRFEEKAEDQSRLYRFWQMAGGIALHEDHRPMDNLVFFVFDEALRMKEEALKRDEPNPYARLGKFSIYEPEQAAELKS